MLGIPEMDRLADVNDLASQYAAVEVASQEQAIRARAQAMPFGCAGECEYCGEPSLRLVGQACAPCRDRYRLP